MRFLVVGIALLLVGCVSHLNRPQLKVTSVRLEDFAGVYTNYAAPWALSSEVTPYSSGAWSADTIKVSVVGNSVDIEALGRGKIIYSHRYEEGKGFHLRNSQIKATREVSGRVVHMEEGFIFPAIPGPLANVFSGTFFLNQKRDLVYRRTDHNFQLAFYFVPAAGVSKEDVVFKRLSP